MIVKRTLPGGNRGEQAEHDRLDGLDRRVAAVAGGLDQQRAGAGEIDQRGQRELLGHVVVELRFVGNAAGNLLHLDLHLAEADRRGRHRGRPPIAPRRRGPGWKEPVALCVQFGDSGRDAANAFVPASFELVPIARVSLVILDFISVELVLSFGQVGAVGGLDLLQERRVFFVGLTDDLVSPLGRFANDALTVAGRLSNLRVAILDENGRSFLVLLLDGLNVVIAALSQPLELCIAGGACVRR